MKGGSVTSQDMGVKAVEPIVQKPACNLHGSAGHEGRSGAYGRYSMQCVVCFWSCNVLLLFIFFIFVHSSFSFCILETFILLEPLAQDSTGMCFVEIATCFEYQSFLVSLVKLPL